MMKEVKQVASKSASEIDKRKKQSKIIKQRGGND